MKYPRLASLFALVLTTALLWCSHASAQHLVNITDPQSGTGIAYKANAKAVSAAYTMMRSDHTLLANATGDAISSAATIGNAIELVALSSTTWGAFFTSGTFTDVN